jgi:hypothetical protein
MIISLPWFFTQREKIHTTMAMKNPKETVQGSAGRAQSILSASLLTARDYLGEHNATVVKLLISMGVGAGVCYCMFL